MKTLPTWLVEKLANCPAAGTGLHAWLFSCARQLHAHMAPEAAVFVLETATAKASRRVPRREIVDAVNNSAACAWTPGADNRGGHMTDAEGHAAGCGPVAAAVAAPAVRAWPVPDMAARKARVAEVWAVGIGGLSDLWERSPVQPWDTTTADDWLDVLFPDAEWLCLATDHPATARSRRREKWAFGPAEECGLIVPSPMTGPSGKGLDGRQSHRCLDNTGPRRWLVIEFDSGSLDEQAALHWHLKGSAEAAGWPLLALCVHSGSKSLHGWYGPVAGREEAAHELMAYAVTLGADPATWNRCQLVRLPGGVRKNPIWEKGAAIWGNLPEGWESTEFVRQHVLYSDPSWTTSSNSMDRGALAA